jgi:hypothetical protein
MHLVSLRKTGVTEGEANPESFWTDPARCDMTSEWFWSVPTP